MNTNSKIQQCLDAADRLLATAQDLAQSETRAADMVKHIIEAQDQVEKQQREYDALIETLTDTEFLELCKLTADKIVARLKEVINHDA